MRTALRRIERLGLRRLRFDAAAVEAAPPIGDRRDRGPSHAQLPRNLALRERAAAQMKSDIFDDR
jgi:hypothetical protein